LTKTAVQPFPQRHAAVLVGVEILALDVARFEKRKRILCRFDFGS
jgi:hypothetical protein